MKYLHEIYEISIGYLRVDRYRTLGDLDNAIEYAQRCVSAQVAVFRQPAQLGSR